MAFNWKDNKASNAILLDAVPGKGRPFRCKFLEAGLVKYSFGVCLLPEESLQKFAYNFVGCPVIISHKDLTEDNADKERVGVISEVQYIDGWYWCSGILFDEEAINLIENQHYNVSCQYEITEYSNNTTNALHNGNPYDKVILNGKPEHLAIVQNPRYENAMIAVNALDLTAENEDKWITIHPNGEDAKGRPLLLKDGETPKEAIDRTYGKGEKSDTKDGKDLYSDENFKYNAKRLNEQFGEKPYSEWKKDVQTMLKKYGKTEEDFDNAIGARKDAFKQSDTKDGGESILDTIKRRNQQAKELKEKGVLKDIKKPKTFEERQQEDIDKGELVELGKFPTKFTSEYEDYKPKDKQSESKGEKVSDTKILEGGIKESQDKYGRTKFSKGNKWADVTSNGGKSDSWIASYGQSYLSPVEWEREKGVREEQLFSSRSFKTEKGARKWALEQLKRITADNSSEKEIIKQAINELKENNMFNKLFNKKEKQMEKDEMKNLFIDCIQEVLAAQNEADEKEEKEEEVEIKEEKAENKCKNESVDKRKLIDEVAGIMKSVGCDDEVIRTAIAKMEKIGYDKSEADTADNCGKKSKNEDEEDEKEEAKNKAKNSIEALKGLLSQGNVQKPASKYITKAQAIELGNQLF